MARTPGHQIDPIFTERWSPRAFTEEQISSEELLTAFEAARWAPSGGNTQPWRFIYSRRGSDSWPRFNDFLVEANRAWAKNASVLIVVLSKKDFLANGQRTESSSYALDTGAAWMSFALQLFRLGWHSHGMAGIQKDKIRADLQVPDNYVIEMMIAVGRRGPADQLPPPLQAREMPNDRQPLEFIQAEGAFKAEWR